VGQAFWGGGGTGDATGLKSVPAYPGCGFESHPPYHHSTCSPCGLECGGQALSKSRGGGAADGSERLHAIDLLPTASGHGACTPSQRAVNPSRPLRLRSWPCPAQFFRRGVYSVGWCPTPIGTCESCLVSRPSNSGSGAESWSAISCLAIVGPFLPTCHRHMVSPSVLPVCSCMVPERAPNYQGR
jgi:hypothetical protein